jgi:hypothetical protein
MFKRLHVGNAADPKLSGCCAAANAAEILRPAQKRPGLGVQNRAPVIRLR